jgi:hypothetical protein
MKAKQILLVAGVFVAALLLLFLLQRTVRTPVPAFRASMGGQPAPTLRATDPTGNTWVLNATGGQSSVSRSRSGAKVGPPIIVKTDVYRTSERSASIGLVLEGQTGERYRPGATKNGTRVSAPALRIVDEAGQVVAQGNFSYGWGGTCRYSWRVPDDFQGKFQVQVDIDLGPFEVKHEQPWLSL